MKLPRDITGLKFCRLTAIKPSGKTKNNTTLWLCKCDCGNEVIVRRNNLQQGRTKSCGCLKKEEDKKKQRLGLEKIHGMQFEEIIKRRNARYMQDIQKTKINNFICPICGCDKHYAKGYCRVCYAKVRYAKSKEATLDR